jgi:preprotein translocase subunit SecD
VPVVIVVAMIYLFPTIQMAINKTEQPTIWPYKKINLGLDLQGGMHLVLEVETEKAIERHVETMMHEIKTLLRTAHIKHTGIRLSGRNKIAVTVKEEMVEPFNEFLNKEYKEIEVSSESGTGETTFLLSFPAKEVESLKKMTVEQAIETIRNRIDEFGVSEPDIRLQGENRILIQLPGIKDTNRAKNLIGRTALLEFRLVDEEGDVSAAVNGSVPPGSELLYETRKNRETGQTTKTPMLIKKRPPLTGADLTDAKVQIGSQYNEPHVAMTFSKKGGRIFERVTGENVNKRLAIVLDNTIYSAPNIRSKISGGSAIIEGNFTMEEARDLAIVLRAGALPAPVNIIEERTVGPSLGQDSINKGLLAGYVGSFAIMLFMVIYYKGSGVIADIALFINIIMLLGGLAAFQATLTLPGIAGIILTIGMAVDANVLIFERMREELRLGKTPLAALNAGFERATVTIIDSNLTTLIVALVLFQFGTGPVKGFAVTLCLGIIISLFTSLYLTRLIFDYFLVVRRAKSISI